MLGFPEARWKQNGFLDLLLPRERESATRTQLEESAPGSFETLCSVVTGDDRVVELRWTVSCEIVDGKRFLRGLMIDVTDARRLVREMAQGQKLESVGRIAAGVAHEINTSVQFISDSVRFVRHALKDVPRALADYRALAAGVLSGQDVAAQARRASETDEAADVDYFLKNAPDALDRALEGIGRVGSIVRSMTEFAHPDSRTKADVDINRAIRITLNMARNEYKAVAEVVTDFGDIPAVRCHAGDVNQVVLNLLLNAAHAIGDAVGKRQTKGRITVVRAPSPISSRSPSPTPATAFPKRCARGSSSRSSRPRKSGAVRARGSRCRAASWSKNSRVHFTSKRKRERGRRFSSDCPCRKRPSGQLPNRLQHDFSPRVICR